MKRILIFFSCFTLFTACTNDNKRSDSDLIRESQEAAAIQQRGGVDQVAGAGGPADSMSAMPGHDMAGMDSAKIVPGKTVVAPKTGTLVLEINTVPEAMKYDIKTFTVNAGQKVIINFNNPDSQQHNLVIGKVGSLNKIGNAANALAADPDGLSKGYVPDIPEVIIATPLLTSEGSYTLEFTAPSKPGDYPFMCTFPGHWMMMNGIMKVVL